MMEKYLDIIKNAYTGYANYLWSEISNPSWHNYFYWLIGLSLFMFLFEQFRPWHSGHKGIRKDFWLDVFYMFFNFFLFSLVIYNAASEVFVNAFKDFLAYFGVRNLVAIEINSWPVWSQLLSLFVIRDFIQWWVHRLLHTNKYLWEFHKVHHSVKEMGFAAHLRYHWMETIVYRTVEYLPLAMIGFGIDDFFIVHIFALAIGHLNHANIPLDYGPLKYLFNNPKMHIWHHARDIPGKYPHGVNFGISLSIWDYLFKTDYIPKDGKDLELGFEELEKFPKGFWKQITHGFRDIK